MGRVGWVEVLVLLVFIVLPFWRIFQKAGYPGAYALSILVPGLNVIAIYFLAFSTWPSERR